MTGDSPRQQSARSRHFEAAVVCLSVVEAIRSTQRGPSWDASLPLSPITRAPVRPMARLSSPLSRASSDSIAANACSTLAPGRGFSQSALRLIAAKWSVSIQSPRWSRPHGRRLRARALWSNSSRAGWRTWAQPLARSTSSRSAGRSTGLTRSRRERLSIAWSSRSAGFSSATPRASTTAATPGFVLQHDPRPLEGRSPRL